MGSSLLTEAVPRSAVGRLHRALGQAAPALLAYAGVRAVGLLLMVVHAGPHRTLTRLASLWDAWWYGQIMRTGYSATKGMGHHGVVYSARAFFPLFPWLAEPFHRLLPISAGFSLLIVSWTASLVAAWGIYACAALVLDRRAGVVVAVLWGALPLAAVENMAYSEALFTALCAWSLYAALTRRWFWAGWLGILAGLTRPTAMALTGALGVAALAELVRWWRDRQRLPLPWRPVAGTLLSLAGWVGYILWTGWREHSWTAYFRIQSAWNSSFDGGATTLHWFTHLLGHYHKGVGYTDRNLIMAATVLGYLVLFAASVVRRQPLVLVAFSAAMLVVDLGNAAPYPPLARFLLPAFPLLFPLAERLARIRDRRVLVALLALAALASGWHGVNVVFTGGAPA